MNTGERRIIKMPKQAAATSRQDYGTPIALIDAVEHRFGTVGLDLAATSQTAKAPHFITSEQDSLSCDWAERANNVGAKILWLNPPFNEIPRWVKKCDEETPKLAAAGRRLVFLTPASVGANWFARHIYKKAMVIALRGRLIFEGEVQPYPKDCMLTVFGLPWAFAVWKWR